MFRPLVFFCLWHLVDGVNVVSVMEGDCVTLHIDEMEIYRPYYSSEDQLWIGPDKIPIVRLIWVRHHGERPIIRYYENERFRDRLQVNNQTGSLTIRNCRTSDSGVYQLQGSVTELFNVTVNARLPIPIITRDSLNSSSSSSSSESRCVLLCSVVNVSHVTLSWYKGNSLLSSISVSDVISSVSLHLEVEYQNTNIYGCVLKNSFTELTEHPHISNLCQTHPNSVRCCGFTEAVIRLVLSAVVGVATVAIVVYDITFRRADKKRNENT